MQEPTARPLLLRKRVASWIGASAPRILSVMHLKQPATQLCVVVLVGLLVAWPLVLSGFPPSTIDGAIHVRWAHHAAEQLWSGSVYPRYFPELNNNFGSPSFFYYPPLSSFAAAVIWPVAPNQGRAWYALGWSAALGLILSGVFMWLFLRNCTGRSWVATLSASLYLIAPYHLGVDLLDRGANAECWAFALMPLVLLSFHRLSAETRNEALNSQMTVSGSYCFAKECAMPRPQTTLAAFILAALFCCHVLTTMTFALIAFGYTLWRGRATCGRAIVAGFWALLLSAIYLLPTTMYSKYVSGSENAFFMGELFRDTFFYPDLRFQRPLLTNDAYHQRLLVVFAGQLVIQFVCVVSLLLRVVSDSQRRTMLLLIAALQFCIAMMLPISEPLYVLVPPLQRVQFAWRFLAPATFICSIMIGILAIPKNKSSFRTVIISGFAVATFILTAAYVNCGLYQRNGLTKTGVWREKTPPLDFHSLDAFGEYVPVLGNIASAEGFFGGTNSRPSALVLLSGQGEIAAEPRTARHLILRTSSENGLRLLLHQFWFPGWFAKDSVSGEIIPVTRHVGSGLVEVSVPKGQRNIDLRLSILWPEAIGLAASTASGSWLLGLIVWRVLRRKRLWDRTLGCV